MKRLMVLASVVVAGMLSANCSNSHDGASSASLLAPSAVDGAGGTVSTAAKGGGGGGKPSGGGTTSGSSTLTLVMSIDANGNGLPNWNDTVTFNWSTTVVQYPLIDTVCSQNGTKVYYHQYSTNPNSIFPENPYFWLQSGYWTGGAADCVATLNNGTGTIYYSLSFHVDP
jgi:hypothetical protein